MNYLPKTRLGLSALAGCVGFILGGLAVMYGKAILEDNIWQISLAAGISLFVGVYSIDVMSEWLEHRSQK